jgi:Ca2+/Na+ antiporter
MAGTETRFYMLLSYWSLIASLLYPLHGISTFPLILLCSIGILEIILNPNNQLFSKNVVILLTHLLPFIWIPFDTSRNALNFAAAIVFLYVLFIIFMKKTPIEIYTKVLQEKQTTTKEFICERFGFCGDAFFS